MRAVFSCTSQHAEQELHAEALVGKARDRRLVQEGCSGVEARAAGSQEEAQVECERLLGEGVWIKRLLVQQAERHLNGQLGAGRRQALRLASVLTGAQRTWRRATWT